MREETPQEYCIKNGLKIYPVYQKKDYFENGVVIYKKGNWYVEVDNNCKLMKYKKSIGVGMNISSSQFDKPIRRTYQYYKDQINNR